MTYEIVEEAERELRNVVRLVTTPHAGECLHCYVERMLEQFGCDGSHRFTWLWDDAQPKRVPNLFPRLTKLGGCCCDCEVLLNVYREGLLGPTGRLRSCRRRPKRRTTDRERGG